MGASLRIRGFTSGDISFADGLREMAGWNQTSADWRRFLAFQPLPGAWTITNANTQACISIARATANEASGRSLGFVTAIE